MSKEFLAQFGGKITQEDKDRFAHSPQWNGKVFKNQLETSMDMSPLQIPTLLKENFKQRKVKSPKQDFALKPFNLEAFETADSQVAYSWYGHSALMMRINGKNLLIDPMLGPDASPIAPFKTKRFSLNVLDVVDDFPQLDAILITHDHYDHLDYTSIRKLKNKCSKWLVALGVGRHLVSWGIPKEQIQEFDWWDETVLGNINITFTPSRHFSGRGTTDRAKSLWGGWVFKTDAHAVYWSGDGGYGPHFKTIQERLGSFDLGFMECGQYNKRWHAIHMYPEEAVQAAIEAEVRLAVPVHWGAFSLALHTWWDPIMRFTETASQEGLNFHSPKLGSVYILGESLETEQWWRVYMNQQAEQQS